MMGDIHCPRGTITCSHAITPSKRMSHCCWSLMLLSFKFKCSCLLRWMCKLGHIDICTKFSIVIVPHNVVWEILGDITSCVLLLEVTTQLKACSWPKRAWWGEIQLHQMQLIWLQCQMLPSHFERVSKKLLWTVYVVVSISFDGIAQWIPPLHDSIWELQFFLQLNTKNFEKTVWHALAKA